MFSGKRIKLKYLFMGENLFVLWQVNLCAFTLLYKEVCFYRISVVTGRHSLLSKLYCSSEDVAFMCINFLSLHRETILALLCTVEFYFSFIRFAVISL